MGARAFPTGPSRLRFPDAAAAVLAAACLFAALLLLGGCDAEEWPDREPVKVERAPVDSLEFLPIGSRFVLRDSLTQVLVRGLRPGYECTRLTAFGLEKSFTTPPEGWTARVDLELPTAPDCPVATTPLDTALNWRFTAADGPVVRLMDTLGAVLDTAALVRGSLTYDSLALRSPSLAAFKGRFFFRDSSGALGRELTGDSLTSCEFLNQAEYTRHGDTTKVRFSWVTLDPAASPDTCKGPLHRESLPPLPSRR